MLKKNISNVVVNKKNIVKNQLSFFVNKLLKQEFLEINRVGKLLIFHLPNNLYMLVHLKMTGQLIYTYQKNLVAGGHNFPTVDSLPNKYSHIIFYFSDGSNLFFNDMRQFGYMKIVDHHEKEKIVKKFGIEPGKNNFTLKNFKDIIKNRKGILKAWLLDQRFIAGIGNIYADEICFRAAVLPSRTLDSLSDIEIKKLWQASKYIIQKAIDKKGTTFSDYRDDKGQAGNFVKYLKVYGRAGKQCLKCKQELVKKVKLAGRGTHFCSHCQK